MLRRVVVSLGLCLGLAASTLHAQDPRLTNRLAVGTAAGVQRLVDSATALALPTEPLVLKALEGASKGADSTRITLAVRALLGHLQTARDVLGRLAGEPELVAGAAALRAGAPRDRLAQLSTQKRSRELTVPLSVLADLLTSGVPADDAWKNVSSMVWNGASDAQFLALRDRMNQGRPPLPPAAERPPTAPLPGTERTP
jgi:hypothetical protein